MCACHTSFRDARDFVARRRIKESCALKIKNINYKNRDYKINIMNSSLSLVVWFFTIIIVLFIFWYLLGYGVWQSLMVATLISLFVLLIIFPWNLEHHHNEKDCHQTGHTVFYFILAISVIIIIAYLISSLLYV
jgi:hypothetical protein